jgi:PAS domain S-box-containing protein
LENFDDRLVELFFRDKPFADALECLFEDASDAIYILDKNGNFVTVNRKAEELMGFKREEHIGKSFRKIIPPKSLPKAIRGSLDVIQRGNTVRFKLEIKRTANKTVLVEVTSRPLIIKGKIVGALGISREITEHVQMENKLKETNRKLQVLFDTAMEGIAVVDAEENLTFVNRAFADMLGYREDELVNMNLQRLVDGQGFKEIRRQTEIRKKGKVGRYELVIFGKDGKPRIFQVSATPLWNEDDSFAGSLAIVTDVTERKRMEEKLCEREEKFRKIFENASDSLIYLDTSGRILDVNEKAVQTLGGSKEELLGRHFIRVGVFSLRDIPKLQSNFARILRGKEGYTSLRIKNKKGQELYLECSSSIMRIDSKIVGILVIARDITERKKMEESVRDSEEKLRAISNSAKDAIISTDNEGTISFWNPAAEKMFGYAKKEAIGKGIFRLLIPKSFHESFQKELTKFKETGTTALIGRVIELALVSKSGVKISVELSISAFQMKGKWHLMGIIRDITERKEMEEKLKESEEKWRSLVKNAPNIITVVDHDGKIQFINRTVIDASPEEIIGRSIYDFIDPTYHDLIRKTIRYVFQIGEGGSYEISGTGPDGGTSWYATQVGPIKRNEQIVSVTLIATDITERKQMQQKLEEYSQQLEVLVEKRTRQLKEAQEQLIKSERLATIGQVAAMVGHDLRNPLTGINSAAYYLKTKLDQKNGHKIKRNA